MHKEKFLKYVFVHHCDACLHLSSVGARGWILIPADYSTSLFRGHTETATEPAVVIAECLRQYENIALSLGYLQMYVSLHFEA